MKVAYQNVFLDIHPFCSPPLVLVLVLLLLFHSRSSHPLVRSFQFYLSRDKNKEQKNGSNINLQKRLPPARDAHAGPDHGLDAAVLLLDALPRRRRPRRWSPAHVRLARRGRPRLVRVPAGRVARQPVPEPDLQSGARLSLRMDRGWRGGDEYRARGRWVFCYFCDLLYEVINVPFFFVLPFCFNLIEVTNQHVHRWQPLNFIKFYTFHTSKKTPLPKLKILQLIKIQYNLKKKTVDSNQPSSGTARNASQP